MLDKIVYDVGTDHSPAPETLRIHDNVMRRIERLNPGSVLEIGCGIGMLARRIADLGCRYVGIEPDAEQYELARNRTPDLTILPHSCYADPMELGLGKFDLVFSSDVIEHLYLPRKLVAFAKAHMAEGGAVMTATPHYGNYFRNLAISLTNRWDAHHTPLWDGGHIKFFSRRTLRQLFAEQGFTRFEWSSVRSRRAPIFPMSLVCIARP